MNWCKVADITDWHNPDFQATAALLKLDGKNRKAWEFIHVYNGLKQLGCLHENARCLGLGVGREPLVYALTNVCQEVVATDLYNSDTWSTASFDPNEVYNKNRFPYRRDRLTVHHMDMTQIGFPDNHFDLIWSCCAIEHVNNFRELHQVYQEIHRVLKPGGIAALTTECNKTDQPLYEPNLLYTDRAWVEQWLTGENPLVQGFELIDRPDFSIAAIPENEPIPRREPLKLIQVYTKDIVSSSIAFFLRKSGDFSRAYDETWLAPFWRDYLQACDRQRQGDAVGAETLLRQLFNDPSLDRRSRVRTARRLLVALEAQNKIQEMLPICQAVLPDCYEVDDQDQLMPIANFCRQVELIEPARTLYERIEHLRGSTINQVVDSITAQALCLENLGRYETAVQLLERAQATAVENGFRTEKSLSNIYFNLGWCYEQLEQFDRAESNYRLTIDTAPPEAEIYQRASRHLRICQLDQRFPLRPLLRRVKQFISNQKA